MKRIDESGRRESDVLITEVQGEFRTPVLALQAIQRPTGNERWKERYERAFTTGKPAIINNVLLLVPQHDEVGRACANPAGKRCEFAKNFVSDMGVLTVGYVAAYKQPEALRAPGVRSVTHGMAVDVAGRTYGGELLWFVSVTPASLPAPFELCNDFSLGCFFYPKHATTTDQKLVIRGVFGAGGNTAHRFQRVNMSWWSLWPICRPLPDFTYLAEEDRSLYRFRWHLHLTMEVIDGNSRAAEDQSLRRRLQVEGRADEQPSRRADQGCRRVAVHSPVHAVQVAHASARR